MHSTRLRRRLPALGVLTAGGVLLLAGPAYAHVTIDPTEAPQGGFSVVNFKVPNEKDDASTVKLEVDFPIDHPLANAMPQPVPGWDVKVEKTKLAKPLTNDEGAKITEGVSKITWTGGAIKPGTFQQFPVSLGPLPKDTKQIALKALQTYDDKEVVRWIEVPKAGSPEPENPAPVLKLTSSQKESAAGAASDDDKAGAARDTAAASDADSSDITARTLGIVGIVLGAGGVAFGVLARRRPSS